LVREGFFQQSGGRTIEDIVKVLKVQGVSVEDEHDKIVGFLARRVKKGILKKSKNSDGRVCWRE
jgi:hypothetical protein